MRLKVALPVAVAAVTLLATISLLATSARVQPTKPEAIPTAVRVTEVTPEQVRMVVHSQGTAAPRTESDLVPEVAGKVVWISPTLVSGGAFHEGELLLRIDERDYAAAAGRARAALLCPRLALLLLLLGQLLLFLRRLPLQPGEGREREPSAFHHFLVLKQS